MDEHFPQVIWQWLGNQRSANNESIDTVTKNAANICGARQATGEAAKGAEPLNRNERTRYNAAIRPLEENALRLWSKTSDVKIHEYDFVKQYATRQIRAGADTARCRFFIS